MQADALVWVSDTKGNRFGLVTDKLAFVQVDDGSDQAGPAWAYGV